MNEKEPNIQDAMMREMKDKKSFDKAQAYAYEYLEEVFDRQVFPQEKALKELSHFEEEMPSESKEATEIIDFLNKYGAPATMAQLGGRYFGFVNGSAVPAGLAAKNLATYWDQNTALQVISPLAAKLESVVEKWLIDLFQFPKSTVAGFVSGTSSANLCGLAAARYRLLERLGWDVNKKGLFNAPKLRVVANQHAHASVIKALGILGFGKESIEWVATDDQGRILPELLPNLDAQTIVILQAGNVNSGAFDDFETICTKAQNAQAWVHIDGAFGLWARTVDQLEYLTKGMEKANSWAVDGHKTLNTPYDSGIILCRDKEAIVAALHMTGSYIILGQERDGMFYTPEMSRRARIIELWATLKYLGKNGINQMIYGLHKRAVQFGKELSKLNGFNVLNDIVFNQVVVCCETDELTEKTLARIQKQGVCWVGGSSWQGKKVIRISVCSWATTEEDVLRSVQSFATAFREVE